MRTIRSLPSVLLILTLALAACSPAQPAVEPTLPSPTLAPQPSATATPAPTATLDPNRNFTPGDLLPAWQVTDTSALTEQDLLPALDIMSNAVARLQEVGYGEQLKDPTETLLTIGGRFFLGTHTLEVFTGLNTYTPRPVYAVYLYDQTAGCFLIPVAVTTPDPSKPDEVIRNYPHSGDISELASFLNGPSTEVELWPLYMPAGLGSDSEMRLVATTSGIVPGVFYGGSILVGWFDFEKREWHITSLAKSFLESNYASVNTPAILENNLRAWLDGTTVIAKSDLFEYSAGKPRKFNLFDRAYGPGSGKPLGVYGVLLGLQSVEDNLFAFMGFEDARGTRFSLPINLGVLSDPACGTYFSTLVSNLGKAHTYNDQSTYYQCDLLRLILANTINQPLVLWFYDSGWEALAEGAPDAAEQAYAAALAQFIAQSASSTIGDRTFDGRLNLAPGEVSAELVPALYLSGLAVKY